MVPYPSATRRITVVRLFGIALLLSPCKHCTITGAKRKGADCRKSLPFNNRSIRIIAFDPLRQFNLGRRYHVELHQVVHCRVDPRTVGQSHSDTIGAGVEAVLAPPDHFANRSLGELSTLDDFYLAPNVDVRLATHKDAI